MNNAQKKNIVRLDWLSNRTPSGRRSATKARKLAQYFALGRGRAKEQELRPQRGQWLDPAGRPCRHEEVLQWVREQGTSHEMTYQFILSVKETELTAEAFNRAMAAGGPLFDEWRLIQHTDTDYPHAHALAFGDRPVQIKSEAFQSWWLAVRQALEREQAVAIEMQREQALEQAHAAAVQQEAEWVQQGAGDKQRQAGHEQDGANGEQARSGQLQREAALVQESANREQAERLARQVEAEIAPPEVEREQDQDLGWDMGF
ncbi:MAG: hypothetical protein H6653_08000 [Ardenticatenaceae bacterium]|nr:hypothetical protein [Ardenticatenaceae bacterium]